MLGGGGGGGGVCVCALTVILSVFSSASDSEAKLCRGRFGYVSSGQ